MKYTYLPFILIAFLTSCTMNNPADPNNPGNSDEWLIPANEVQDGGPGKDGIPSVDDPQFVSTWDIDFLSNDDLVIGVLHGDEVRAYPHPILDWHEIVNDESAAMKIALTYCPLTGTAIGWNREINGKTTTFGVSGKLYNNNLIPYDRETDSYWSQAKLTCVNGELVGTEIETLPVVETSWGVWKLMFPESKVLSTETGFNRNYNQYPYGDYKTNHNNIIFPLNPRDERLPSKERVLGIIGGEEKKVYSINDFEDGRIIIDNLNNQDIFIAGHKENNYMIPFINDGLKNLIPVTNAYPIVARDEEDNEVDIFGRIIAGPRKGERLEKPNAYIGYWFTFGTFFPEIEIFE